MKTLNRDASIYDFIARPFTQCYEPLVVELDPLVITEEICTLINMPWCSKKESEDLKEHFRLKEAEIYVEQAAQDKSQEMPCKEIYLGGYRHGELVNYDTNIRPKWCGPR